MGSLDEKSGAQDDHQQDVEHEYECCSSPEAKSAAGETDSSTHMYHLRLLDCDGSSRCHSMLGQMNGQYVHPFLEESAFVQSFGGVWPVKSRVREMQFSPNGEH